MAKQQRVNNEEEARVVIDPSNEEMNAEQHTAKDTETPAAVVSTGKKNVKIRPVEDIDCLIACKPYKLYKDKEVSVPSDVAAILCYAKKAYRL